MLNMHELERRWIKYKIKSSLPYLFSILGIAIITILVLVYFPQTENKSKKLIATNNIPEEKSTVNNPALVEHVQSQTNSISIDVPSNTQVKTVLKEQDSLVLKPSLHFMDNIENGLSSYVQDEYISPNIDNRIIENKRPNNNDSFLFNESESEATNIEPQENKLTLSITSKKNDSDLKDLIRRFKKNKNPALSLFIAKHYYDAGNYQKSYNYALMTNEIDKSIDASWIIFSKSLVKLGQQELAMNTLKSYLKTSKSSAAEVLLRKIQSGNFK